MTTFSALATCSTKTEADKLAAALEELDNAPYGVGVFEIEDGRGRFEIGAYFMDRPDETALAILAAAFGATSFVTSEIGDRDWVSEVRRELSPVHAGRFVVHGGHDRDIAAGRRHALEIEAAMAFGTGHHGTTRGCLLALDRLAKQGFSPRRIADIGCGTGVLAMAAASVWKQRVLAADIDQIAVDTTRANMRVNHLGPFAATVRAPGFTAPMIRSMGPYHLVLANILARPLRRLAPDMARHTTRGGVIILSGILNDQRAGVEAVYVANGFARLWIGHDGEWSTLVMRR
ncbi:MAG: 50S ribosomal protein L11 methyltransferase [Pseudomonadota bacterium]